MFERSPARSLASVTLLAIVGSAASLSLAQTPSPAPAPAPVQQAPAPAAPDAASSARKHEIKLSAEVKAILDRAAAAYLGAKTYQDKTRVDLFFGLKAASGDTQEMPSSRVHRFAYAGPRAFVYHGEGGAVFAKDQTITCAFYQFDRKTRSWTDGEKEVVKVAAEGPLDCADNMGTLSAMMPPTPVQTLYMSGPGKQLDMFLEANEVKTEDLDGQPGAWVIGKGVCNYTFGGPNGGKDVTPIKAWFSAKTGLLERVQYDISRTSWALGAAESFGEHHGGGGLVTSATATVFIKDIVLDAAIDDAQFVYAAGKHEDLTPPPVGGEKGRASVPAARMGGGGGGGMVPAARMGGGGGGMVPAARMGDKPGEAAKPAAGETIDSPGETLEAKLLNKPAPEFKAKTPDDKDIGLSDFKGKVVLLDVWATWCGPCMQAIPAVQRVSEHFKDQPVAVIGINRDKPSEDVNAKVRKALERKGITFHQAMDQKGDIAKSLGVTALPSLLILDKQGIVRVVHVGAGPGEEEMLTADIEKVLKGETTGAEAAPKK